MEWTFKPAIYRDSALYEFPLPVDKLLIRDAWDFQTFKIPLADGTTITGGSQKGVEIIIEGRYASQAGTIKTSEEEMFNEIKKMRGALDVPVTSDTYSFFIYYDSTLGIYRKFKSCLTVRFESDLSNGNLFTYSAVIYSADPLFYSSPPGS